MQYPYQELSKRILCFLGESDAISEDLPMSLDYQMESFQKVLPYEQYDDLKQIYFNEKSIGFVMETAPLIGCSEEMMEIIASILRDGLPDHYHLQVHFWASPHVGKHLDSWQQRQSQCSEAQRLLSKERISWLKEHILTPKNDGTLVRDFRVFWSVSVAVKPHHMEAKAIEMLQVFNLIRQSLKALNIPLLTIDAEHFIQIIKDITHPCRSLYQDSSRWDPYNRLRSQCLDPSINLNVYPQYITFEQEKNTWTAQTFIVSDYPKHPSQWSLAELVGDPLRETMRQPYPFLFSLTVHMLQADKAQAKAEASFLDRDGKMKGTAAKFIPRLKREHADWSFVRERLEDGEKLVELSFLATVFAPIKKRQEAATQMQTVFKRQMKIVSPRRMQWPLFLSQLPMLASEGYFADLKRLGVTKTATTFNAANLMPLQGEKKGQISGQLFLGIQGQLAYWDPFSYQGDNYNVAVAATSGAGKSASVQDYIVNLLADSGRCWVIDVGRNYLKTNQWLNGTFLAFGQDSKLILNPLSKIQLREDGNIDDDAFSLLKPLFGIMARPKGATTEEEDSWLEQAIQATVHDYGTDSTITFVAKWLKGQNHSVAKNLAHLLYPYTKDGMYARWFEGKSDLDFNNPFIVLELEELSQKRDLREIVLMLLMHHIHSAMYLSDRLQKKSCIVDEAWDLLQSDNTNTARFIETGYRRARRYRANFVTITQGLDDYYRNRASKAALESSSTLWLLKHKPSTIQYLEKEQKLPFDGYQTMLFKNLHRGQTYTQCMIVNDDGYGVYRIPLEPFSRVLYSSKGEEFERVKQLQETGLPLLEAVKKVARNLQ